MTIPKDLQYTNEHEWVRIEGNTATIGITDYAQGELGDIVFVELPAVGSQATQMDAFGTIEAVKAVSELFSPVTGKVTAVNDALQNSPELINQEPYTGGWMVRVELTDVSELDRLLSAAEYEKLVS